MRRSACVLTDRPSHAHFLNKCQKQTTNKITLYLRYTVQEIIVFLLNTLRLLLLFHAYTLSKSTVCSSCPPLPPRTKTFLGPSASTCKILEPDRAPMKYIIIFNHLSYLLAFDAHFSSYCPNPECRTLLFCCMRTLFTNQCVCQTDSS